MYEKIAQLDTPVYGVVVSDGISVSQELEKVIQEKHPDAEIMSFSYDRIGVDDAANIRSLFTEKHWSSVRVCFVVASSVGIEAQNALLKTFEELPERNHVIVVVPHKKVLIDTIWSRIQMIEIKNAVGEDTGVSQLFSKNIQERLKFVDTVMKKMTKQQLKKRHSLFHVLINMKILLLKIRFIQQTCGMPHVHVHTSQTTPCPQNMY
jgi:DNA polymerase III delta prime subunit